MYEFAIVVLLGIGIFKLIDMVAEYVDLSRVHSLLTLVVSVLVAWALNFSLFAQWGVAISSDVLGYIATGLMIAAAGYATPKVFEHIADVLGRRGEPREPQVPRAA